MRRYRNVVEVTPAINNGIGILNLNPLIIEAVEKSGFRHGFVIVRSLHTTAGILVQEDEKGILEHDLPWLLTSLIPKDVHGEKYRHDDFEVRHPRVGPDERENGWAHLAQTLVSRSSEVFDIADYKVDFGTWVSALLIDFDPEGRKSRKVAITVYEADD